MVDWDKSMIIITSEITYIIVVRVKGPVTESDLRPSSPTVVIRYVI